MHQHSAPIFRFPVQILLYCFFVAPIAADAAGLEITSPTDGAVVTGAVKFSIRALDMPGLQSVQYYLNGQPLSGPLAVPPYDLVWQSGMVWDGPAEIGATARDRTGKLLASSPRVRFTIANGPAKIRMVSPDPSLPLKGTVNWTVAVDRTMPPEEIAYKKEHHSDVKPIEAILFALDGNLLPVRYGSASQTVSLDTTALSNGYHELFAASYSTQPGIPPVGMVQSQVKVDNGHTIQEIRADWSEIHLAPGDTLKVSASALYTDGVRQPLSGGVTYSSAEPAIAAVDAAGLVRGIAEGMTSLTAAWNGHTTSVPVFVEKPHGFPHFTRDGQMVQEYDPARSLFVRDLFNLGPAELSGSAQLIAQLHDAGINTLNTGFYQNPADGAHQPDYETWRKGWDPYWDRIESGARAADMNLVLTGDDIARTANELNESIKNPWVPQAIQHALDRAEESKRVIGVEMIDEASGLWGGTPKPTDGRWLKMNPPIPDDAFTRLMKIIQGAPARPPISWPVLGIHGLDVARNWEGDPTFCDYTSHYWDVLDWRRVYPWGASIPQYRTNLDRAVLGRYPGVQHDRPALLLMSICGPYYQKNVPGGEFTPGSDTLMGAAIRPEAESVQVMYAAARGMAGIRAYGYDSWWKDERKKAAIGAAGLQTGSDPFETGTDRWQPLSAAFNLTRRLEPVLLQPQVSATDAGPAILAAARRGPNGAMLMAINFSEGPTDATLNLALYRTGGKIVRYRLRGATLSTGVLPDSASDSLLLGPAETAVYVFLPRGKPAPAAVSFAEPLADETISGPTEIRLVAPDTRGLDRIEFLVDGKLMATLKKAPFRYLWNPAGIKAGTWHSLSAVTYGATGVTGEARMMVRMIAFSRD